MGSHLITLMILFPFLGAITQIFLPNVKGQGTAVLGRWIALGASLLSSACGLGLVFSMGSQETGMVAREVLPWLGSYAISYSVALDGLSAVPILLLSIIFPVLIVSEWGVKKGARGVHGLFLLLQSSLVGIVCAQDLFLIFFFWSLSTLPFYFLMAMWGDAEREKAAFRYMITSSLGNAFFFAALVLVYYSVEPHTFSMQELLGGQDSGHKVVILGEEFSVSGLAFLLFSLGLSFRVPVFPFHGWFSFVSSQAPASVSVAMCGAFVPVSVYLFSRISYSLFPSEITQYSHVILILGAINALFGAFCALAQKELRSFLAFLCMAQLGILLMGVSSLDSAGMVGAVYQGLTVGIGLAGFGLFSGLIKERLGHSSYLAEGGRPRFGGISERAPILALVTGVILASLLGFPGLGGFVGQSLIMMGGYSVNTSVIGIIGFGVLLLTFGLFSVYRYVFLGKASEGMGQAVSDLSFREQSVLFPLVGALLFLGVYPKPLLDLIRPSVQTLLAILQ